MKDFKYLLLGALCAFNFYAGYRVAGQIIDKQTQIVTDTVEKEKIITKIVKEPGGKEIVYKTEYKTRATGKAVTIKEMDRKWSVGLSAGAHDVHKPEVRYTLDVYRKVLKNVSVGVYGRTDKEFGVGVRIEF